jgi:hypothetical protein
MTTESRPRPIPAWATTLVERYQAGITHAFVLSLNTTDLVEPLLTVRGYLNYLLKGSCPVIAWYDRASGITFPVESMRPAFFEATGYTAAVNTPLLSALRAVSPGAPAAPSATPAPLPVDPTEALPLLERLLRTAAPQSSGGPEEPPKKFAVIVDWSELVVPATDISTMAPGDRTALITIERWGRDPAIIGTGNIVILLARNLSDLHPSLRAASSRYETIRIPLPDTETRRAFIVEALRDTPPDLSPLTPDEIARLTGGLQLLHCEDILLRARYEYERTGGQSGLTPALIQQRKAGILETEFGGMLEILEPRRRFSDIAGLEPIKDHLQRVVIRPLLVGDRHIVPTGILLSGPPGTGKTALGEAVAAELGLPFVLFNPGNLLGQYVGQSEANLERALAAIEALAPVGVFVDEVDQAVSRGTGGDSGVSSRIFGRLLAFIADPTHRGQILWMGATNYPNRVDAALRRPGRFGDLKIAILPPTAPERATHFRLQLRKYTGTDLADIPEECVATTEGWTGAEIEQVVRKAAELVYLSPLPVRDALLQATQLIVPTTADLGPMINEALDNVDDLSLLPEAYRQQVIARRTRPKFAESEAVSVQRAQRRL